MSQVDITSAVIVRANSKGYTATLHFTDKKHDRIISHYDRDFLHELVERYVEKIINPRPRYAGNKPFANRQAWRKERYYASK